MTARRFVWRWSARLLRLEWRQHLVIVVLVSAGVALSVGGAVAAFNLTAPPASQFGNGRFAVTSSDPDLLGEALGQQGHRFGAIERATADRAGTTERVDVVTLDPANDITAPLLALIDGRLPAAPGEVAITDRALAGDLAIGDSVTLGDTELTVVGFVENPTALDDEFVFTATPEQLEATAGGSSDSTVQFFIDADPTDVELGSVPSVGITTVGGPTARTAAVLVVNAISLLGLVEIALLAGSTFAVVARRRSRQYGLLAAAGATPQLIRSAATVGGVLLGAAGAALGLAAGLGAAVVLLPGMEATVGHRIELAVPLWAVVPSALIAVIAAGVAARLPAAALSKLSIVQLLASTRPQPAPGGRLALAGVALAGIGGSCLVVGFAQLSTGLALLGTVLTPVGLLLVTPLAVSAVGRLARRLPVPERLAGRTVARHNRRSAAVVAAVAMALAVPTAIVVVTSSIDERALAAGPNVADNQLIVWADGAGGDRAWVPADIDEDALERSVATINTGAPDLTFVPIEVAVPRGVGVERDDAGLARRPTVAAARRTVGECTFCDQDTFGFGERDDAENEISYDVSVSWIATPALLAALQLDDDWLAGSTVALVESDDLKAAWFDGIIAEGEQVRVGPDWPRNASVPPVLVSPRQLDPATFDRATIGWLGVAPRALTADDEQAVLDHAPAGVVVEFQEDVGGASTLQIAGLATGLVLAVGMTVSAVGLLMAESADDTVLLASLGAPSAVGRRMSAAAAALLGLCGAVIGVAIGYLPLLPMVLSEADGFPFVVPWASLAIVMIGFPAVGGVVGWLTSGRSAQGRTLRQSF